MGYYFVQNIFLSIASFVCARAVIAFAHAHGWYPEKQIAAHLLRGKILARDVVGGFVAKFVKPHVENAPGLIWVRLKREWRADWRASKRGHTPKAVRLWRGNAKTLGAVEKEYIADRATHLQSEMLGHFKN